MATIWLEHMPTRIIDDHGVRLSLDLGDCVLDFRAPRSAYRAYLQEGIRDLDAADRAQQDRIAHLRQACPLPPKLRCR